MFEISELKAKTLVDLQQIAKSIGLTKTSQLKKLDLVYQILDLQAASPSKEEQKKSENLKPRLNKPKRKRVVKKVVSEDSITKDKPKQTSEDVEKKATSNSNISEDKQHKKPIQNKAKPNHKKQKQQHNNNKTATTTTVDSSFDVTGLSAS